MEKRTLKNGEFENIPNPFANKQKPQAKTKQYAKPDPSAKVVCSEDRPVKMNPTGKYNLNFIDWNNEYESVLMRDPHSYESPIHGMSDETFQNIMDEEFAKDEDEENTQSVLQ